MTKYITVKMTEDQVRLVHNSLQIQLAMVGPFGSDFETVEVANHKAFIRRTIKQLLATSQE